MEKKKFNRYIDAWFNAARVRDSLKKENPAKKYEIMVGYGGKTIEVLEEEEKTGNMKTVYECTYGSVE